MPAVSPKGTSAHSLSVLGRRHYTFLTHFTVHDEAASHSPFVHVFVRLIRPCWYRERNTNLHFVRVGGNCADRATVIREVAIRLSENCDNEIPIVSRESKDFAQSAGEIIDLIFKRELCELLRVHRRRDSNFVAGELATSRNKVTSLRVS